MKILLSTATLLLITTNINATPYQPYGSSNNQQDSNYNQSHTYQKIGNTTYGSDGSTSQRIGNTTYINDANGNSKSCQEIGNTTYCN